jgi:hypothetical protein
MKIKSCLLGLLILLPVTTSAQQGHPLAGIWLGDWGAGAADRKQVVVELTWTDTSLGGNINPGYPDQAVVASGKLDSANGWKVHIEAAGTDESGKDFKTVLDGQLDEKDLGSSNRSMTGTWTQAGVSGTFNLRRE